MTYLSKIPAVIISFLIFTNIAFANSDVKQALNEDEEVIASELKVDTEIKQKIIKSRKFPAFFY